MKNPIINTKLITKKQFTNDVFNLFGLKLDFESVCMYKDSHSCNKWAYNIPDPLVFTASFVDHFGFSWANINGSFYAEHTIKKTDLFKEFKKYIENHTFKHKNHFYI